MKSLIYILDAMRDTAAEAGKVLLSLKPETTRLASRKDFLTSADLKADAVIEKWLTERFPDIPYFSEEKEGKVGNDGLHWRVDPVDGTVNYFLGVDDYAVSIALVDGDQTIAGVVYLPARQMVYETIKGHDAVAYQYLVGDVKVKPIRVNTANSLKNSQFWTEWVKDVPDGKDTELVHEILRKLRRASIYPQMRNCAAGDPMAVANGKISGFIMTKPDPFDVAAAGLIVRQAGGTVTDIEGNPWNANSKSIVATNGKVHQELLDLLNS